jgi:hypothetical protein
MPSPQVEHLRRGVRWGGPALLLVLLPKCLLCAAAYLGLAAALGVGGAEMCGVSPPAASGWREAAALGIAGLLSLAFVARYLVRTRPFAKEHTRSDDRIDR